MENQSRQETSEQGQQASSQSTHTRPPPTAEELAEFAASNHQTKQKREASEAFATEYEAPVRRTEAPRSTGVHNQRFVAITPIDQSHPSLPAHIASSQELSTSSASPSNEYHALSVASTLSNNADMRKQLRDEIRKEVELLYDSRLARSTADLETLWRGEREEKIKEVEKKLTEVSSKDKDETTRDLHEEIEKLKARLEKGPGLIEAAEERTRRQGELDGINKVSLSPELEPSQERLNFDFLMKEKDKEIAEMKAARSNWLRDTQKFSKETSAKLREQDQQIQQLQALVQISPPQPPSAPDNTEALVAAGRELQWKFDNQTLELISLREQCNQQAVDFASLTARLDHISQESISRDQQLSAQSAELSKLLEALDKKTEDISLLRRESDHKSVDSSKELENRSKEINALREEGQKDLAKLEKTQQQVRAQSNEIASLQTRCDNSESSNKEKDRKIASLRELLDSPSSQQSNSSDHEEIKFLKEKLAEKESFLNEVRSENASLRQDQARSDLQATSEMDSAAPTEADTELVRAMLEKERERIEAQNSRRENRVNETLERLGETEQERRQILKDELDRKEAELYDAQKRISNLEQQFLASSSSELSQAPSQAAPILAHALPSLPPTTPAAEPSPSPQRSRFLGPRSLLIVILIFLLTFLAPFLHSLATSGSEYELVGLASREDRMQWEAWELADRERDEGVPSFEESWRRTQEVGEMGDWGL